MNLLNIFKFVLLIFFIFFKALLADQINPLKIKEIANGVYVHIGKHEHRVFEMEVSG